MTLPAIIEDSEFSGLKVGTQLLKIKEGEEYVRVNGHALHRKLQKDLGYQHPWERDFIAGGGKLKTIEINEWIRPIPYTVDRIVTKETGHRRIYLSRPINEQDDERKDTWQVNYHDLHGAFTMLSFNEWLIARLEKTMKQILKDKAKLEASKLSEEEKELEEARKMVNAHAQKSTGMQEALEKNYVYAQKLEKAAKLIKKHGK